MKGAKLSIWLAFLFLLVLLVPSLGATSDTVTINATPAFVSITNSPDNWTLNGTYGGSGTVGTDAVYYSNPNGEMTAPNTTVDAGDCRFNMTNSSTVATDITVNIADFTGGDAMTNSNTGANGASSFGAYTWYAGLLYASKVVAQSSGSAVLRDGLPASTALDWGAEIETQSGAWSSVDQMSSTMTISAAEDS